MSDSSAPCIWCPDRREILRSQFDEHVDREHPELSDPRQAASCWSQGEVCTPDGTLRKIACGRARHRWGKHRNRGVRWSCPPRCGCIRHARERDAEARRINDKRQP